MTTDRPWVALPEYEAFSGYLDGASVRCIQGVWIEDALGRLLERVARESRAEADQRIAEVESWIRGFDCGDRRCEHVGCLSARAILARTRPEEPVSDQLNQDLYLRLMDAPDDLPRLRKLVRLQARVIHEHRKHSGSAPGSYNAHDDFEQCGVRWCKLARRIAADEPTPPQPDRAGESTTGPLPDPAEREKWKMLARLSDANQWTPAEHEAAVIGFDAALKLAQECP